MDESTSIEFNNIRFCYGEVCAVNSVSFNVHKNGLTALVGPNGGGKSTLLKLLTGLLSPDEGNITIKDNAAVGYVPQDFGFDESFPITVEKLVLSGTLLSSIRPFSRYSKQQKQKAGSAIERVGLKGFEARGINQLSAGQLKRAVIARALAADADIIVLDEPDASLDVDAARELYNILCSLKQDKTIIVASHSIDEVLDIADSAIYVNKTATEYIHPMMLKEKLEEGMVL